MLKQQRARYSDTVTTVYRQREPADIRIIDFSVVAFPQN